ncbi:MAG TPA: phosphatidate cytidylyltransferase [Longimicrobiales bacterium]|nr:phosphatidate cytidylyltransferase [Longimicrobiales bacterium]
MPAGYAPVSELAKRWAVAGVGIPAVLALLYVGGWPLALPLAALAAGGALECYALARRGGVMPLGALGAGAAAALVLVAAWRPTFERFAPLALALTGALAALALLGAMRARWPGGRPLAAVGVTVFGALYAGLSLAFVPLLHELPEARGWVAGASAAGAAWAGAVVVVLPLAATWLGDALAFFAGTRWGHGGLAPAISPKKSWVGLWAGLAGAALAAVLWLIVARGALPGLPAASPALAAAGGVVLGVGALLGDLSESMLKREAGVKDSGTLFPGHGGVLDRLDALTFTLPASYVLLVALGRLA